MGLKIGAAKIGFLVGSQEFRARSFRLPKGPFFHHREAGSEGRGRMRPNNRSRSAEGGGIW